MNAAEIQELLDFISKSGLDEVNLETSEIKLKVKKHTSTKIKQHFIQPALSTMPHDSTGLVAASGNTAHVAPSSPSAASAHAEKDDEPSTEEKGNLLAIKSPMIGTFYRSPNPDVGAFVQVGDRVNAGQAVCIIEAMKLFNEIESEFSGTIVKVLVDDASPVEYDQPLFLVDPS